MKRNSLANMHTHAHTHTHTRDTIVVIQCVVPSESSRNIKSLPLKHNAGRFEMFIAWSICWTEPNIKSRNIPIITITDCIKFVYNVFLYLLCGVRCGRFNFFFIYFTVSSYANSFIWLNKIQYKRLALESLLKYAMNRIIAI